MTYEEEQYLTQREETGLEKVQRTRILEHLLHQVLVLVRLAPARLALAAVAAAHILHALVSLLPLMSPLIHSYFSLPFRLLLWALYFNSPLFQLPSDSIAFCLNMLFLPLLKRDFPSDY